MEIIEEIEERWDRDWLCETDKAWDAIHRCLTDGSLSFGNSVRHKCVLGPGSEDEESFLINLLTAAEVQEVAKELSAIGQVALRQGYDAIDADEYDGKLSDDDFAYTWENFDDLRAFYQKAASAGRGVVFTVDV